MNLAYFLCCFIGHDDKRIASLGGVIEFVKCRRCKRIGIREF